MNSSHSKPSRWPHAAAAIAASLVLAGCGGGGGDDRPAVQFVPGTQVPTSATTSVAGVIAFLMDLIATTSETGEPIAVGDAVLSTSETEDATPL